MENILINNLNVNIYKPNNIKGSIIFTHGIAEYSKSYHEIANYFLSNDYLVITYDLRGHGRTRGKRGYVKSYHILLNDLKTLVDKAKTYHDNVFLVGHSLGGVITNLYASIYNNVNGVIISSSPTTYLKELKAFRYIPKFLINFIKIKTWFEDPSLLHENNYQKDEYDLNYFYIKYVSEALIKGMKQLIKNTNNYQTPILMFYSEKDKLSKVSYGKDFYEKIASEDKELIILKESYHNIFNDIEKQLIYVKMLSWVNERI